MSAIRPRSRARTKKGWSLAIGPRPSAIRRIVRQRLSPPARTAKAVGKASKAWRGYERARVARRREVDVHDAMGVEVAHLAAGLDEALTPEDSATRADDDLADATVANLAQAVYLCEPLVVVVVTVKDEVSTLRIKEREDGPCCGDVAVLAGASYRMMPVGELAKRSVPGQVVLHEVVLGATDGHRDVGVQRVYAPRAQGVSVVGWVNRTKASNASEVVLVGTRSGGHVLVVARRRTGSVL